jgi:tetratricopeptide (TPR) repeat protein
MSSNDWVTALLALAAVIVSVVAIFINDAVDKRAARSSLTDLAVTINQKAASYDKLNNSTETASAAADYARTKGTDDLYTLNKELEMLVGQAEFLINRLRRGPTSWLPVRREDRSPYPPSVNVTLAQALESAEDPWWAERYWKMAVDNSDPHWAARAYAYWAMALCNRYKYRSAQEKVTEALREFPPKDTDARIFRGDIYASVIPFEPRNTDWRDKALAEYRAIPPGDEQETTAEDRIKRVEAMVTPATPPDPAATADGGQAIVSTG